MKIKYFVPFLIIAIMLVGCGNKADTPGDTTDEKNNQVNKSDLNYEVKKEVFDDTETIVKIAYPQVTNYPNEETMIKINQNLRRVVDIFSDTDKYGNVSIDYEITRQDNDILSVLYKGTVKFVQNMETEIEYSTNINMPTAVEITYDNFVKDDEESKNGVIEKVNEKAKELNQPLLEDQPFRIYFKGEDIVFYYFPADDSNDNKFIEIPVQYDLIKNYVNPEVL